VISLHKFADNLLRTEEFLTAEAEEFPYGAYQTFAMQMWLGA